ncbi:MAG: hypothetical protein SPK61_01310, partial [Bacteroidales bacterium]|nr:hypothetical protein [Bacteroidales bacterium]
MATLFISLPVYSVSVWDGTAEKWTEGSGTESDPYQIQTAQQFAFISIMVNSGTTKYTDKYFVLTDDIDLNYIEWTPIGINENYFEAVFDGAGHTVEGLKVTIQRMSNGLFGFSNNIIKNLSVSGVVSNGIYSGGIVGVSASSIINCRNSGSISSSVSNKNFDIASYSGGIVGYVWGPSSHVITNCSNTGSVSSSAYASAFIDVRNGGKMSSYSGGIVGCISTSSTYTIKNCCNTGDISAYTKQTGGVSCELYAYSAGIKGYGGNSSSSAVGCYNTGTIYSKTERSNGQEGGNSYSYGCGGCEKSYNVGHLVGANKYSGSTYYLESCGTTTGGTSKTESEMKSELFPSILNGSGEAIFVQDVDNINDGYPIFAWQKSFDVVFKNDDGTVLQSENLLYGDMPVYKGQDPIKPSDAQFSYTFAGWQPELTEVTGEQTYTAQYNSTTNKYVVRFLNEDGTELQSEDLEYGAVPVYTGATPTKDVTAQYTYTFNGWDSEVGEVTGAKDYTATYSSTTNKYLITFENYNGDELQSSEVEYGQVPSYTGVTPEKQADVEFTYAFSGWSPEVVEVVGAQTYSAQFSSTVNKYLVRFLNEDGTELQSEELEYGTIPVYSGEVPTKQSTAQYTYTFNGWDSEIETVTAAKDYKATYTSTINSYVVRFLNDDGSELQSEELEYGAIPVYSGETPTKDATAQYTYTFNGWDSEIGEVTGAKDYNATYTSTINSYLVRFFNEDGTELQSEELEYGAIPVYAGEVPIKQSTAQYTYSFNGWNSEIGKVTGAKDYTATYSSTTNKYLITFENYNGDELQSREVDYGLTPTYTGATPIKPSDAEFTYTFAGWSPELTSVTSAQKYTAQFSSTTNMYLIRFLNSDGIILQSENLEYGSTPSYKGAVPTRPSTSQYVYKFSGWNNTIEPVESATDYMATYTSAVNKYEIRFVNYDGTELQRKEVSYGDTPIYTGAIPVRPSTAQYTYSFRGWDSEIVAVDESKTYTATYTGTVNKYTVTLSGVNCDVTGDGVYDYGTIVELKATPNECTHFIGWSDGEEKEIRTITVTGDVTLTATAEKNTYNVETYSSDTEQGSVISSAENPIECGASVTIEAVPNDGYAFQSWSDGNTDNPRTIVVDRDYDISAQWNKITPVTTYDVRLIVYKDDTWGTVTGDGTYKEGETATLNAVPASGYNFSYWYDPATQERFYENPLSFVVEKAVSLTASFSRAPKIKVTYGQRSAEAEGDDEE